MEKKKDIKRDVERLFEEIVGCRFGSYADMESWFKHRLKNEYPQFSICDCKGINNEVVNGDIDVDFSIDCTFGEELFGFAYADFTVDYIKDNAGRMYITYARWN